MIAGGKWGHMGWEIALIAYTKKWHLQTSTTNRQLSCCLLACFVITVLLSGLQPAALSLHKARRKGEECIWSSVRLKVLRLSGSEKYLCTLFFQCLSFWMLLISHRGRVAVPSPGERDLCPVKEALIALFRVNKIMWCACFCQNCPSLTVWTWDLAVLVD